MSFLVFGGAEAGGSALAAAGGAFLASANKIVSSTGLSMAGSYVYSAHPADDDPTFKTYGVKAALSRQTFLLIGFLYRYTADLNANVAILELGQTGLGSAQSRRLVHTNTEAVQLFDNGDNSIGSTAAAYIAANTTYPMLYYMDQRTSTSHDILWIYKNGAWSKQIDSTTGIQDTTIDQIAFGTGVGKTLPITDSTLYWDEMFVQDLATSPNTSPVGSVTTKVKMPSANGTDSNFNTGAGISPHPDFRNVDEIPANDVTDYDQGDTVNDKQSYAIANATSGDVPLAIQVIGQGRNATAAATVRTYIYDGTTRDTSTAFTPLLNSWRILKPDSAFIYPCYNKVNGATITESLFNSLEAGMEITALNATGVYDLSQIALEYIVPGPYALPSGFPKFGDSLQLNQAVNIANTY